MGSLSLGTLQVWTLDGPELAALKPQSPCSVQALWLRALGLEALTLWTLGPLDLAALGLGLPLVWGSGVWICNVHSAPALSLERRRPFEALDLGALDLVLVKLVPWQLAALDLRCS